MGVWLQLRRHKLLMSCAQRSEHYRLLWTTRRSLRTDVHMYICCVTHPLDLLVFERCSYSTITTWCLKLHYRLDLTKGETSAVHPKCGSFHSVVDYRDHVQIGVGSAFVVTSYSWALLRTASVYTRYCVRHCEPVSYTHLDVYKRQLL